MRRILAAAVVVLATLAPGAARAATAPTCLLRTFVDTGGQAFVIDHLDGLDPLANYRISLTLPDGSQQSNVGLAITPAMNDGFLVGTSFPAGTYAASLGQFFGNGKVRPLPTSCTLAVP